MLTPIASATVDKGFSFPHAFAALWPLDDSHWTEARWNLSVVLICLMAKNVRHFKYLKIEVLYDLAILDFIYFLFS